MFMVELHCGGAAESRPPSNIVADLLNEAAFDCSSV